MTTIDQAPLGIRSPLHRRRRQELWYAIAAPAQSVVVVLVAWLAGAAIFFRAQVLSGFHRTMGNDGDTRLIIYITENWYRVFTGHAAWRALGFFYPTGNVLGYSDCFALYSIFYAPLRALGMNEFLAFQVTLILLSLLSFVCFVILVRLALGAPLIPAVVGAWLFTFSNALWVHGGSQQLFGVYFIPGVALLGLVAWRERPTHRTRSAILGCAFGFLVALLLFTSYYVAWFGLLTSLILGACISIVAPRRTIRYLPSAFKSAWQTVIGAAVGFGIGIIPFLLVYLPVIRELGARHYRDAMFFAPKWNDIINVGSGNLLWGRSLDHLWSPPSGASYEVSYAITPLLFVTVLTGGAILALGLRKYRGETAKIARIAVLMAGAVVILTILPTETSLGSFWAIPWHLPGATAIRAIDRIQVVSSLLAAISFVAVTTHILRLRVTRTRPILSGLFLSLGMGMLLLEQINAAVVTQINVPSELSLFKSVPAPPASCQSFFIMDSEGNKVFYAYQIDAMLISQRVGIPTINGYSGNQPPGWAVSFPKSPDYLGYVKAWATAHGLVPGLCSLDEGTMKWSTNPRL